MGGIDEGFEFGIGAEMRIDAGEIGHPIAVIASTFIARTALHRFVFENWRKPDRGRAKALDIIKPRGQPFQITAMIEPFGRRIEPMIEPRSGDAAAIIGAITIFESVRQDEIDDFILRQAVSDGRERCLGWGDLTRADRPPGHSGACAKRSDNANKDSRHDPLPQSQVLPS